MKTISIRELHEKTGQWVRQAGAHEQIVITERGRPVAALAPYRLPEHRDRFRDRRVLPAYRKLRGKLARGAESTALLSADRDRQSDL
ncbi:MAG TPA: type II toxin-antitoxin system prevent-host-death family antitoxin [Chthoniobacterales bacterium]|jgi:prevent-host-death family protein